MSMHELTQNDEDNLVFMVEIIRQMNARGENPGTGGNYSYRPEKSKGDFLMISESGVDKGVFGREHFIGIDEKGEVLPLWQKPGRKSSAETGLHLMAYEETNANCVLHSHSLESLWFCDLFPGKDLIDITGLEMIKAITGFTTHEETLYIPVFENSQDIASLSERARKTIRHAPGFLIRGHGLTCWGSSVWEAKRHLETFNYLFQYFTKRS